MTYHNAHVKSVCMLSHAVVTMWPRINEKQRMTHVRFVLLLALYASLGAVFMSAVMSSLGFYVRTVCDSWPLSGMAVYYFVGPAIETLFQVIVFDLVVHISRNRGFATAVAAVALAAPHSLLNASWGVIVLWPCFLFAYAYACTRRQNRLIAMSVAWSVHGIANILVSLWTALFFC